MNTSWSDRADRVRRLPLAPLAASLGYVPDPRQRARWKRDGSLLSLHGDRFYDHLRQRGGGGAVDLVMHALDCGFRAAVRFLETASPHPHSPRNRTVPVRPALRLPARDERAWPAVRDFLLRRRSLHPAAVRACRDQGSLYADSRRNAVFLCRLPGQPPSGAELVGTRGRPFKSMAPGSRKARGAFLVPAGRLPPPAVLLVESAIDALSAAQLPLPSLPPGSLLASTAGTATRLPAWLLQWPPCPVFCGFDRDPPGDRAAALLAARHARVRRLPPPLAKDWNDVLRLRSRTARSGPHQRGALSAAPRPPGSPVRSP